MLKALLADISRRLRPGRTAEPAAAQDGQRVIEEALALWRARDYEGSRQRCRQLIAGDQHASKALELLGAIALELGDDEEALRCFEAALEATEPTASMLANAAEISRRTGRLSRAMALCDQALKLQPDHGPALHIRVLTLQSCWRIDEALSLLQQLVAAQPEFEKARSSYLFLLNHLGADPLLLREEHIKWAKIHAEPLEGIFGPLGNERSRERRLRVGYVSADFCEHAASHFILSILEHHDASRFEVFCYSNTEKLDDATARLKRHAHRWRDIRWLQDAEVAAAIRADAIDILVDLSGHSRGNRLRVFARRAAPVQATYLGYPATTGLSAMDYRITDALADPPGKSEPAYRETLLRMPDSMWCFQPPAGMPEVGELPAAATGRVTFGSLNSMLKLTPRMIATWARILRAVPESRLVLVTIPEGEARTRLTEEFAANSIPASALEFHGRMPREPFWALHKRIDIALDSFPCNGGATTCETLWLGVPVVSLASAAFQSRAGLSLLSCVGLPQLVAHAEDDYVRVACELARETSSLANVRAGLRARMLASALMDAPKFTRALEGHYRAIWRKWCNGAQGADGSVT